MNPGEQELINTYTVDTQGSKSVDFKLSSPHLMVFIVSCRLALQKIERSVFRPDHSHRMVSYDSGKSEEL